MLSDIHILTVSHKELPLDEVPGYAVVHHHVDELRNGLERLKACHELKELYYLSTCNRVLYLFVTEQTVDSEFISNFFDTREAGPVKHFQGEQAVYYLFQVASSIHSMVVGEREIITQIRTSYEEQVTWALPGDNIRMLIQQTIRAAKKVYAATRIGEKPVSVVSLAIKHLLDFKIKTSMPIILVGAGSTNQLVIRHLTKKGFKNISVYNRSVEKAQSLVNGLNGHVGALQDLIHHPDDFGCLIACTGANRPTVTMELAKAITGDKIEDKIWIDLGLPADIDPEIHLQYPDRMINLQALQETAKVNLEIRQKEIRKANEILESALNSFRQNMHQRRMERAFQNIPAEIRNIKEKALTEVFKNDLANLDSQTREVISKMMNYMEKKCISVPMKAVRETAI
jgi:glutamyl-tRNA reductase